MKKLKVVVSIVLLCALLLLSTGCATDASVFNSKINGSPMYSLNMRIEQSGSSQDINVKCVYNHGKYAYQYTLYKSLIKYSYRQIFTDNMLCEVEEYVKGIPVGNYRITEEVATTDKRNFIYQYMQQILAASYLTMLTSPTFTTVNGKDCKEYLVEYEKQKMCYIFDDDNLLVKFILELEDGKITVNYSDYLFKNVDLTVFNMPDVDDKRYTRTQTLIVDDLLSALM